jgi:alpha-ketoglutarate-dependent taurine dioxygenase
MERHAPRLRVVVAGEGARSVDRNFLRHAAQGHPIVRTHARTGRTSLYVTGGAGLGIEGLPDDEGTALIEELPARCGTTPPRCIWQSVTMHVQNGE